MADEVVVPKEETGAPPATPIVGPDGKLAADWIQRLPEDIRNEECLKLVPDFPGAIKQLVHAKKVVGTNKVAIPTEKSSPEEWSAYYDAGGRPKTPADYKATIPEELKSLFTDERIEATRKLAHEIGISQKQFDQYLKHEIEMSVQVLEKEQKEVEQARLNAESALKKEFGAAYEERMHVAKVLIAESFPDSEERQAFLEKYGDDPDFIRFASKIGNRLVESKAMIAEITQQTPKEAQTKIHDLMNTPGYLNGQLAREDPAKHRAIVNELRELNKLAYPEEKPAKRQVYSGG